MIKGYKLSDNISKMYSFNEVRQSDNKYVKVVIESYGVPGGISYENTEFLSDAKFLFFYFTYNGWKLVMKKDDFLLELKTYKNNEASYYNSYIIEACLPKSILEKNKELIEYILLTMSFPLENKLTFTNFDKILPFVELSDGVTQDVDLVSNIYDIWISTSLSLLPKIVYMLDTPFSVFSYRNRMICRYRFSNKKYLYYLFDISNEISEESLITFLTKIRKEKTHKILEIFESFLIYESYKDIKKYGFWIGGREYLSSNFDSVHYFYGRLPLFEFIKALDYIES